LHIEESVEGELTEEGRARDSLDLLALQIAPMLLCIFIRRFPLFVCSFSE